MSRLKQPWRIAAAVGILSGGAFVVAFGWRVRAVQAEVAAAIPVRPELDRVAPQLAGLIGQAETRARGYTRAAAGLADLGRLYHANGFLAEAGQCYESLGRIEPREARWPHLQAAILAGYGRLAEAIPLEQRVLVLAPDHLPARVRLGDFLLKSDQTPAAAAAYAAARQRDPDNPYALLGLARCSIMAGDWTQAREFLQQAVAAHPEFGGGWGLLVAVHEHFADRPSAAAADRRAKATGAFREMPDPWLDALTDDCYDAYQLSVAAASTPDKGKARHWLERAIELAPGAGSYQRQLSELLFAANDYAGARQRAETAARLAPASADAWGMLLKVLERTGDRPAADRALQEGLRNCPNSGYLHFANGQRLRELGRFDEAVAEQQLSKICQPSEARPYIETAMNYFSQNRVEDGVAEMKAALAVEPGNTLALALVARHAINSNDEAAARHWIQRLREQPSTNAEDLAGIEGEYAQQFGRRP